MGARHHIIVTTSEEITTSELCGEVAEGLPTEWFVAYAAHGDYEVFGVQPSPLDRETLVSLLAAAEEGVASWGHYVQGGHARHDGADPAPYRRRAREGREAIQRVRAALPAPPNPKGSAGTTRQPQLEGR